MASLAAFEFQSHIFHGRGGPIHSQSTYFFPNVIRLNLEGENLILPSQVILKKKDIDNPELFDQERDCYETLQHLQGRVIPTCFGVATIDDTPALVLSDVGGVTMNDVKMPYFTKDELSEMLGKPLRDIRAAGVVLEDASLMNVHYCADTFWVLDFELVKIDQATDKEAVDENVQRQVGRLVDLYQQRQTALQEIEMLKSRCSVMDRVRL